MSFWIVCFQVVGFPGCVFPSCALAPFQIWQGYQSVVVPFLKVPIEELIAIELRLPFQFTACPSSLVDPNSLLYQTKEAREASLELGPPVTLSSLLILVVMRIVRKETGMASMVMDFFIGRLFMRMVRIVPRMVIMGDWRGMIMVIISWSFIKLRM